MQLTHVCLCLFLFYAFFFLTHYSLHLNALPTTHYPTASEAKALKEKVAQKQQRESIDYEIPPRADFLRDPNDYHNSPINKFVSDSPNVAKWLHKAGQCTVCVCVCVRSVVLHRGMHAIFSHTRVSLCSPWPYLNAFIHTHTHTHTHRISAAVLCGRDDEGYIHRVHARRAVRNRRGGVCGRHGVQCLCDSDVATPVARAHADAGKGYTMSARVCVIVHACGDRVYIYIYTCCVFRIGCRHREEAPQRDFRGALAGLRPPHGV
jgi:hypothetical protein